MEIDSLITAKLASGWSLDRLDKPMKAILRAGTYELIARADVPVGAVITEYVDVAHAFYDKRETGVVNGLLDAIGNAMGYAWILLVVSIVREIFGSGAISLPGMGQVKFLPSSWFISEGGFYENNNLMILPPMALITVGIIIWIQRSRNEALIEEN